MERAASDAEKPRRRWLPWWLLAGSLGVMVLGGWGASRSISSLMQRVEQLEREAGESEARVAELQVLRDSMARRLRLLEQQQQGLATQNAALNKRAGDQNVLLARREAARTELEQLLKAELEKGEVFLTETEGRLKVELADRLLFEPRKAALTPAGAELLTRVGAKLAVEGHLVQVAAHTDAVPETAETAPGPTSWELSSARAVTVVRLLGEKTKLGPERLVAAGYGPYHPVVVDDGPLARERNRRLELQLMPAPPRPTPPPAPAAPADQRLAKKRPGQTR
ncbi:chemotaxis protein MotB [Archangium gephyra]|uniref:Chemotaxis protein MotB n=1 Tax=Archangium gephyra TaxID=48 RepID=A0AAC8TJ93_9BACT|nr:OmpA family protein [Archangium gephyra]AKJ08187.1 Flagellar motor rotation protein MotB [Archangium gephyra]REG29919.1 chemotaxis protein MotB [Archangium gephyra]